MKVKDIMTKDVMSVNPEESIKNVAELMYKYNIGSVPVCEGEKIIGIITDRDITLRSVSKGENNTKQKVREIMSSNPIYAEPEMDLSEASRMMSERQIRRLPIVSNDNLVGIVSLGDMAVEPNLANNAGEALSDISLP
ncbi:MAG: CBS domain-containing protein [Clostridiaceae bacterium]